MTEHVCKTILLGESGVGKTSIINKYLKNDFMDNMLSTSGNYYLEKIVEFDNNEKIRFEIWDTIGQEKYRSVLKKYYQCATAAILVYDISKRNTFEEMKNYWVNELKENGPKNISMFFIIYLI